MNMTEFEDYARQIAAGLGPDWTAACRDAEWRNCVTVTHTDGSELRLRRMENGTQMVVRGSFPVTDYLYRRNELPKLTVAIARGAGVAAQEITSEVMPLYMATLANVRAYNDRHPVSV